LRNPNPEILVRCPECRSDALYKYGKTKNGKERYLCLICNRQFTTPGTRKRNMSRPLCPQCGGLMHLYKREAADIRLRCARYPECRTYLKVKKEGS
jgi:ssDNA-binding Zn-finger/Zn-ribbon topoisomerase 1